MTPRTPKPKPVEAWAVVTDLGNIYLESLCHGQHACEEFRRQESSLERIIRVRIVPIVHRKPRTKRKEKKK